MSGWDSVATRRTDTAYEPASKHAQEFRPEPWGEERAPLPRKKWRLGDLYRRLSHVFQWGTRMKRAFALIPAAAGAVSRVGPAALTLPVLAVGLLIACDAPTGDDRSAAGPSVTLAVVGQALIEHDPRQYMDAPLATVAPILAGADAVFTNLEVAIAGPDCACTPTRDDVFFHGAGPEVLDYLNEIGVSLLSLANNHSWDYGDEGIVSTVAEASKRGFTYAGTGGTMAEAVAPAYRDVGAVRVGLVALATVSSLEGAEATEISAGVNMLEPDDDAAWDRNIAAIEEAAANADFVITYQHYQVDAGPGWQEQWAHAAVDAGADLYVSHGEPRLAGVEEYRGGLILHGLGNFIFHSRTEIGNYPPEVWESAVVSLSLGTDGVREATFTPVTLDEGTPGDLFFETRGYPEVAAGEAAEGILGRLARMSAAYGTTLELRDGQAHWRAERPGGALRTAADFIETVEGVQDPDSDGLEGHTIESMMDELGVPGVSVAVIRDFDIHWAKGYGVADVETGVAVDIETLFQAASISKPVAAMAVLRAVQDGSFSMDEDINGILTSWQLDGGEFTREHPVTPRMLTSHTSGLGDGFGFPGYDPDDPLPTTVQILNGEEPSNVGDVFMERAPMTAMKYSGGGVTVMQLALSDALGRPFGDILQEYVLDPVGMEHSTFEQPLPPDRDLNATRGHDQDGRARGPKWHVYPELAAAGLWTTPTDLARFAIEVQKTAQGDPGRVLTRSSVVEMLSPVGVGEFAVGFVIEQEGEGWYFSHTGGNWGFRALLKAHRAKGYGVAVMTNADRGGEVMGEIRARVAKAYGWDSLDQPVPR